MRKKTVNEATLQKLIDIRIELLQKADKALTKIEEFCQPIWEVRLTQTDTIDGMSTDDEIAESLMYANSKMTSKRFIEIMDRAEKEMDKECS